MSCTLIRSIRLLNLGTKERSTMVGFIEELQDFGSRLPLKLNLAQLFETLKLASNAKKKKDV